VGLVVRNQNPAACWVAIRWSHGNQGGRAVGQGATPEAGWTGPLGNLENGRREPSFEVG
jgi:hypothetical protein